MDGQQFKNEAFRKRCSHDSHSISLTELSLNENPKWPVIVAFLNSSALCGPKTFDTFSEWILRFQIPSAWCGRGSKGTNVINQVTGILFNRQLFKLIASNYFLMLKSASGRGSIDLCLLLKKTAAKFFVLFCPRPHRLSSGHNQDNQWQDSNWVYYGGRRDRRGQPFYVTQLIAASIEIFRTIGLFMVFIRDCSWIRECTHSQSLCVFGQWCWSNETQAQDFFTALK